MTRLEQLLENQTVGGINELYANFGFQAAYQPESRLFDMKLGGGALLDIGIYPCFYGTAFNGISG